MVNKYPPITHKKCNKSVSDSLIGVAALSIYCMHFFSKSAYLQSKPQYYSMRHIKFRTLHSVGISCAKYHVVDYIQINMNTELKFKNCPHLFIHKWKNHFFKMKGDIGMGWSSNKERNKEWLLSKATQNYMTPSLYLCCRLRC